MKSKKSNSNKNAEKFSISHKCKGLVMHDCKKKMWLPSNLKDVVREIPQPCKKLKYCPYGSLVEQFPLPLESRKEVLESKRELTEMLRTGKNLCGDKLNATHLKNITTILQEIKPREHLNKVPKEFIKGSCFRFGHLCPVYFRAETVMGDTDVIPLFHLLLLKKNKRNRK